MRKWAIIKTTHKTTQSTSQGTWSDLSLFFWKGAWVWGCFYSRYIYTGFRVFDILQVKAGNKNL